MGPDYPASMTDVIDLGPAPDAASAALAGCPHLVSIDGPWHAATPSRAHRCRLLAEGRPTLERQREHCLVAAHLQCPTWLERHGSAGAPARPGPFVATTPVVLEGPGIGMPSERTARRLVAPVTVVVVVAALGALLLSRGPLAPGTSGAAGDGSSANDPGSRSARHDRPDVRPDRSGHGSADVTSDGESPGPAATPRPRTYKVRPGNSLTGIAAKFGTTAKVLATLNKITNPSLIHPGQVLKLP